MLLEFKSLKEDEVKLLLKAPVLVSILIAGADGIIDKAETKEAIELARSKQSRSREQLRKYYKEVGETFETEFKKLLGQLPAGTDERNRAIVDELKKLNFVFPKMEKKFAIKLYASWKDLAKKIAESSGGVLGYLSISYEEAKFMDLTMIRDPALNT